MQAETWAETHADVSPSLTLENRVRSNGSKNIVRDEYAGTLSIKPGNG
jgi:hypothetical protein